MFYGYLNQPGVLFVHSKLNDFGTAVLQERVEDLKKDHSLEVKAKEGSKIILPSDVARNEMNLVCERVTMQFIACLVSAALFVSCTC